MASNWFNAPGVTGVADLGDRLSGLDCLFDYCADSDILDLGSGEGLISLELVRHSARAADCVTNQPQQTAQGMKLCDGYPVAFHLADLKDDDDLKRLDGELLGAYDLVLLLAVLNKVPDPARLLRWALARARGVVAIRTPGETFTPKRRSSPVVSIKAEMEGRAVLIEEPPTSIGWLGIYEVNQ